MRSPGHLRQLNKKCPKNTKCLKDQKKVKQPHTNSKKHNENQKINKWNINHRKGAVAEYFKK